MRKLTSYNQDTFFEGIPYRGEVFTYSADFCLDEVRALALRSGVYINYMPPGTGEYMQHGSLTCATVGKVNIEDAKRLVRKDKRLS